MGNSVSAADIAVGQRWFHSTTHQRQRALYRVDAIDGDRVTLTPCDDKGATHGVSFGALLAYYVPVEVD